MRAAETTGKPTMMAKIDDRGRATVQLYPVVRDLAKRVAEIHGTELSREVEVAVLAWDRMRRAGEDPAGRIQFIRETYRWAHDAPRAFDALDELVGETRAAKDGPRELTEEELDRIGESLREAVAESEVIETSEGMPEDRADFARYILMTEIDGTGQTSAKVAPEIKTILEEAADVEGRTQKECLQEAVELWTLRRVIQAQMDALAVLGDVERALW